MVDLWWKIYYFVLLAKESLAASRNLIKHLLACLNLALDTNDLFWWHQYDFSELWQQHKQLKVMEMDKTWPNIYYEEYIHKLQSRMSLELQPSHKFWKSPHKHSIFKISSQGTFLLEDQSNQHEERAFPFEFGGESMKLEKVKKIKKRSKE